MFSGVGPAAKFLAFARVLSTPYTGLFRTQGRLSMDRRTSVLPASFDAAPPELKPVAVTPWNAQLADAQCERDYRVHHFADDRRRALLLMGLMTVAGLLNFLVEIYGYRHGASRLVALIPPFATICLPIAGLLIVLRMRTPIMLELLMVVAAAAGKAAARAAA